MAKHDDRCTGQSCKHMALYAVHCAVTSCPNYFGKCPVHK
jgi:hypothetical protein